MFAHPKLPWLVSALAVLLTASSLGNGLVLDDHTHRMVAREGRDYLGGARHALDQFAFMPGDQAVRDHALEAGIWPWWGSATRIMFLRPLTAATHWLDYTVWPGSVWLAHLHSMLWYGALAFAAASLYRRTLAPSWVAGLAAVLYALDGGHSVAVGWLATRNMLLAATFCLLAMACHHRWREDAWRPGRWLALVALALSLASAELGVGTLGYLVAYAFTMERGSLRDRALSVTPYLVVVVAWLLAHRALGYGVANTGLYTDPFRQPAAFATALVTRGPLLLASQLTLPLADVGAFVPLAWSVPFAFAALCTLALCAWLFWSQLAHDRIQRWYAFGAIFAVVPACSTFTHSRLNILVGIGAAALLARLIERALDGATRRSTRIVAGALAVRHTILAALLLSLGAAAPREVGRLVEASIASLPDDVAVTQQTLVIVNTPHIFLSTFVAPLRRADGFRGGKAIPARVRTLGETMQAVRVTRVDARSLDLEVRDGYLGAAVQQLAWTPGDVRPAGYTVELDDSRYEVLEATADGRPRKVRVRFAETLEDQRYRWVTWQHARFVGFTPPRVGEGVTLRAVDFRELIATSK